MSGMHTSNASAAAGRDHIRRLFGLDCLFVTKTRAPSEIAIMRSSAAPVFPDRRQRKDIVNVLQLVRREREVRSVVQVHLSSSCPWNFRPAKPNFVNQCTDECVLKRLSEGFCMADPDWRGL